MTICQIHEYNNEIFPNEIVNNPNISNEIIIIQNEIIFDRSNSILSNASTIINDN